MNESRVWWKCTKLIARFVDTTYLKKYVWTPFIGLECKQDISNAMQICAQQFITLSSSRGSSSVSDETFEGKGKLVK